MDNEGAGSFRKRARSVTDEVKGEASIQERDESEAEILASEETELEITRIREKVERYTQLVSSLLDSGKTMLMELSNEFEEWLIAIHKDQVEKWQEEINTLRLLDNSNEETGVLLQNVRLVFQNPSIEE